MPGDESKNIENLQIGIGANLDQLVADLEKAEEKIEGLSAKIDKKPIKIAVTPDIDANAAKAFVAKIQQAVAGQTVKVKVDASAVTKAAKAGVAGTATGTSKTSITDASNQLARLERRVAEIRKVTGNIDVSFRIDKNAADEITRGVITYTNALGQAKAETYKLVDVLDETGDVASREFQFVGETLSESTTKVARFQEALKGVENTLNAFATKNADIADQIGIDELRAKFADLKTDTNAEVMAIQQFKNEMGAAKVKVDEIRAAQKAQTDAQRQSAREQVMALRQQRAEEQAVLQERMAYEQAINQLKTVSMSSYRQEQRKITEILQKQLDIINRRIVAEKKAATGNRQVIAAVQLQKATMETTAYIARLAIYAKDVAKKIERARNNMAGMQGYARSTANIFKGIVLSQAFYKGLNAVKSVVSDAWSLSKALNSAEAAFSGMLVGGQEKAQGLLEVLKQEAINTPFDVNNLVKATRQLTAYGIQAENLMHLMHAIEAATAASGDVSKMEAISRALGQMYTRGKVVSQEIIQLQEAGIAAGEILTQELGLPPKLSQDWGKLNIDANTAINAIVRGIEQRYGKALDNMAKTTEQKINNMKESFALIASSLTDPIRRAIDSIIDVITPKIEQLYQAIQAVGLGNALRTLIPPGVFNAVITAINGIVRAVQAIRIVFQQMKPIITVVMDSLAWYGRVIYNIFISILSALGLVGQYIGESSSRAATLGTVLKTVLGSILAIKAAMMLVAAASKIWTVLSTVMRGIVLVAQGVGVAMRILSATMAAAGIASAAGFLPVVGILLVVIGLVATLAGSLNSVIDAAKRVGAALKNLGGGTTFGNMFKDMSDSLQTQIDAYNAKVAKQNAELSNALTEDSQTQTDDIADASGAAKRAMQGLMSFDEVYKLMESAAGGGGLEPIAVEVDLSPTIDIGGAFDDFGGLGEDWLADLSLDELQNALGDLWSEVFPLLDDIALYLGKMLGYFVQMHLYSKMMSSEKKEQWTLEKQQTSEDKEQALLEKQQTQEDIEQKLQEKQQTQEDIEQKLQEKQQTQEDIEQKLQEKQQTQEDTEQLLDEKQQTQQDIEQLLNEKQQTQQDVEQLLDEKQQTQQDIEQLIYERQQTEQDREQWTISKSGGGVGGKGTAAALALLNIAQIGASAKMLADDFKELAEGGAGLNTWMSMFVNGLMMAVDVLQLVAAFKVILGGIGAGTTAAGVGTTAAAVGGKAAAVGGAAAAGGAGAAAGAAALFLAIPAAVGGILYYIDATTDSIGKYRAEIEKIQKSRITDSKAISDQTREEREYVASLTSQYGQLAGKENLTAQERQRLQNITSQLVKAYPDLNKYIDEESGLLKLTTTSLDSYIKSANQRADLDSLSQQRLSLLEEERILLALLGQAEAEEDEARAKYAQSGQQYDKQVYDSKAWATESIRALLEQNGIDLQANEDAYAENAGAIAQFQEEITESVEERIAREAEELAKQQEAYRQYYLEFEASSTEHHGRLNALSAEGYAQQSLSMDDWLKGMTKRQEQEYEMQENLAKLKGRDIPAGMLAELEAAGPQYSKLISELANANDIDLNKVVTIWEDNGELAKKLALDELGEMPDEAKKLLKRYQKATDEELEELVNSYAEQHKLSREEAIKELTGLPDESAAIVRESIDYVKDTGKPEMRKAYEEMGKEGIEGLSSTERAALRAAGTIADEVVGEAKSRVKDMGKAGKESGDAYADEISGSATKSGKAGDALARSAVGSAKSNEVIGAWGKTGNEAYESYISGIAKGHDKTRQAGETLAKKAVTGAASVSLYDTGANASQTLASGVSGKSSVVESAFKRLLNNMLKSMETFTTKIATALNTMLSDFGTTMNNLSVNTSGKVSYTPMKGRTITAMADGGAIHRAARGIQLLKKPTRLTSSVLAGEDGTEIVFPLENTKFIKSFAADIANAVGSQYIQQAAQNINIQMEQARAGAAQSIFNAPSATEISDAIRSWFTPQMQSLHDVLEQDRTVDLKVPNTTNALYRLLLTELKNANAGAGARGFLTA